MKSLNRFSIDSDVDYYDSHLSKYELLARDIVEGEASADILDDFEHYREAECRMKLLRECALDFSTHYIEDVY